LARWKLPAIAAVAVAWSGWSAEADAWRSYHNSRFGVTADYPAGWKMQPAPENNDGRVFVSPDGRARVTISGIFALESRATEFAEKAEPLDGETVTFKARKGDWIVVSGVRGPIVFYRKALLSCKGGVWNDVQIDYPAEDKTKYDSLVAHIAASLKSGSGYDAQCK
jgi:serine/threonine-protein kinase